MSNILEPDTSPLGILKCTTHHYACDCREAKFTAIEQENKLLRQRNAELQQMINYMMTQAKCDCEYFGRCQGDPQKGDYCPLNTNKAER